MPSFKVDFSVYENGKRAPQYTIDSDLNGEVSLQDFLKFTKANLIQIAANALREEQAKGFDKSPVVTVDGSTTKQVIDVHPLGKIQFFSRVSAETIINDTYTAIEERSPIDTGLYRLGNFVFLNGRLVAINRATLNDFIKTDGAKLKDGDVLQFVNVLPYARKLERLGVSAGRQKSRFSKSKDGKQRSGHGIAGKTGKFILAPNGAYFLAHRSVARIYKGNSKIKFEIVSGGSLNLTALQTRTRSGKSLYRTYHKNRVDTGVPYLYPSIKITIQGGGLK